MLKTSFFLMQFFSCNFNFKSWNILVDEFNKIKFVFFCVICQDNKFLYANLGGTYCLISLII